MGKLLCRNGTIPCITLILGGNLTRGKTRLYLPIQIPYQNGRKRHILTSCEIES